MGDEGCYWARLADFEGGVNSIKANGNEPGPMVVSILKTDKGFESNNCGTWTSDLTSPLTSKTEIPEGGFIVGVDVKPGTYKSSGGEGCYWERLRSLAHGMDSIIANGNPTGPTRVTIKASDKGFRSTGCGIWSLG
jgi:hypothetical protein